MTKQQYFDMCEMMNSEPLESQIPVEFDDLLEETQEVFRIYNSLQDNWDYMGGNYIGKNYTYIDSMFKIYNVEPEVQRTYFELLLLIDSIRAKQIQESKPKDTKAR